MIKRHQHSPSSHRTPKIARTFAVDWAEGVALGRTRVQDRFRAIEWDLVIVDEAHVLKNDKSKLHEAMKMVRESFLHVVREL